MGRLQGDSRERCGAHFLQNFIILLALLGRHFFPLDCFLAHDSFIDFWLISSPSGHAYRAGTAGMDVRPYKG